ncbi:MAG TPA: zinc ABC transporter substrate-binding protein, partial [Bacteroidales bacterium]|nr:zinc ABC transporter substrate-binding protein [Bacteroidales bacterium]
LPQKYLVSRIADTLVDVVVMVPPGASPATWEATPAQMRSLDYAKVYFKIGHLGFEQAWMRRIAELNPDMDIVDMSKGLDLISIDYKHGDHTHSGIDPHIWMSPGRMEEMARVVYSRLAAIFPENKEYLRSNYQQLMKEIVSINSYAKRQLLPWKGSDFLLFHPSLGYLAKDYGLRQHAIEFEGKEPSPGHLQEIINLAEKRGIKVIFVQEEFDQRNATVIMQEIGGTIVRINPLAEDWNTEMKNTINKLVKSFQK